MHTTDAIARVWRGRDRNWKDDGILLFPSEPADSHGIYVTSWERVGQHGGADYDRVIAATRPATKAEARELKRLYEHYYRTSLGALRLRLVKRKTRKHDIERYELARTLRSR